MRILPLIVVLLLMSLPCAAEEPVEIPLDQIWALDMPGTRPMNVGQGDEGYVAAEGAMLDEIRLHLRKHQSHGEKIGRASFVVLGTGIEAMRRAHAILLEKKEPQEIFSEGIVLSIVFFSHNSTSYIHLDGVERNGERISVQYRFVPHQTTEMTRHFALIPINNLPAGEYHVDFERMALEKKLAEAGWKPRPKSASKLIGGSFSFAITRRNGHGHGGARGQVQFFSPSLVPCGLPETRNDKLPRWLLSLLWPTAFSADCARKSLTPHSVPVGCKL